MSQTGCSDRIMEARDTLSSISCRVAMLTQMIVALRADCLHFTEEGLSGLMWYLDSITTDIEKTAQALE